MNSNKEHVQSSSDSSTTDIRLNADLSSYDASRHWRDVTSNPVFESLNGIDNNITQASPSERSINRFKHLDFQTDSERAQPQVINHPDELRKLSVYQLPIAAQQLRSDLIQLVSKSGGHFASGLGAIELTVALHYVFNTPTDRLVWDIGHQTYPHKILTGRRHKMSSIRKRGGLSGFPNRFESHYDAFGVAHAGTSISAALGMALAVLQQKTSQKVVAVIGDGAMTEGMAFEALNHASTTKANMLVVYNDNNMSISPNVGALNWGSMEGADNMADFFKSLGCSYSGPVDGHNVIDLVKAMQTEAAQPGIRVLHVLTRKGKGYQAAEEDPVKFHAVSPFPEPEHKGHAARKPGNKTIAKLTTTDQPTYTQVFSDWICDAAACDDRICAITPAMREGSGLVDFENNYPERYFDVGIAEQHAVTLAAGLACENLKPVVAIYSSFLQRAFDQYVHDVALQHVDMLFAIDRAGLVGADGPTHHGSFDISFARCIPNTVIMTPSNEQECRLALQTGLQYKGTALVRYPRGKGNGTQVATTLGTVPIGKARALRYGTKTAILVFGPFTDAALEAAEQTNATVIDMRFVKPLDTDLLKKLAKSHHWFVTIEDNVVSGGAGSAVSESLSSLRLPVPVAHLGLPDEFIQHGTQRELHDEIGLNAQGIVETINELSGNTPVEKGLMV